MDKQDFEKWALTQPDFYIRNGELKYFNFPFWELINEIKQPVIKQYNKTKEI